MRMYQKMKCLESLQTLILMFLFVISRISGCRRPKQFTKSDQPPLSSTADNLRPAFAVSPTGGMGVGPVKYPYKLQVPQLYRLDPADRQRTYSPPALPPDIAQFAMKSMMACVTEVQGPPGGPPAFKSVAAPVTNEGGQTVSGSAKPSTVTHYGRVSSNPDLFQHAGILLDITGVFVFGEQYAPWVVKGVSDTGQDCWVSIRKCVFVTESSTLYATDGSRISTGACWFPVGSYEFRGEAEVFGKGLRLLPGSAYRSR